MRIDITFDHSDLMQHVRSMLAVKGLKPVEGEELVFTKVRGAKGAPERYCIKVACEAGDLLDACPLCDAPIVERTVGAVNATEPVSEGPRHYRVQTEDTEATPGEPVVLDEELGESTIPPGADDVPLPGEGDAVPSIASLRAQSDRISQQREREKANRRREGGVPSMKGESTRPPEPGEGV
jgi:hypothetical protein